MDPVTNKLLQGTPYAGMGGTQERNALIGVIRNLISEDKYTVDYILNYAQSVGYQRQMAEEVFKELTGLSPKLIVNNNEYYNMPSYVPNMCIAWGTSKSNKEKAFYIVPFEYGYAVMEKDEVNAPIPTVISATIPEAFEELKKVAKGIQTLDKIITKKLLEAEDVQTDAHTVHQVNLPYAASPLQILKKNFKDKVLSVSEFERQASKLLEADEITVDEAEDLMNWKQDLIDEDESYANEVLENNEKWNEVQATVDFDDVMNEVKSMANDDGDFLGFNNKAKELFDSNKDLFKNVDLIEAATRLYQLLLGFSKDEILGNSKFEKKQEPKKAFQMTSEKGIKDFKAWSGAVDTQREIIDQGKANAFDALIEELYPQGIDETKLNDLLWFESDWIYETLGMTNPDEEVEEDNEEIDASLKKKALYIPEDDAIVDAAIEDGWPREMVLATYEYLLRRTGKEKKINDELIAKATQFLNDFAGHRSEETKYPESMLEELAQQLGFKKVASKKVKAMEELLISFTDLGFGSIKDEDIKEMLEGTGVELEVKDTPNQYNLHVLKYGGKEYPIFEGDFLLKDKGNLYIKKPMWEGNQKIKVNASKKVTAENMTLDDIEEEDNKDQVQEEIEKIDETPTEDIFSETTPEQYFDKALQEDKVDTINDVVSKCIDKFSEKFKDFDKYQVKILSYNTKVLEDDKPVQEEMVEDKELNANAILQIILQITNNAEEENIKKVLAVFSITNGELHWTGTVRGENDQVVAFTEEGFDALFEVNEPSEEELEDII